MYEFKREKQKKINATSRVALSSAVAMMLFGLSNEAFATTGTWQDITHGGSFDKPYSIAVDSSGDLFVTNHLNNTVEKLKSGSTTWQDITYGGSFDKPYGITVDSSGDLFVVNWAGNNTLEELKSGSSKWQSLTPSVTLLNPNDITVDNSGDLFVTDTGNNAIDKLKSGSTTWQDITYGGSFDTPNGITVDSSGDLFVTNYSNGTVNELKSGSTKWQDIQNFGTTSDPTGIAVDSSGDLFVVLWAGNYVEELKNGSSTWQVIPNFGSINGPTGIAVDSSGDLFVTNYSGTNAVEEYVNGTSTSGVPTGLSHNNMTQTGWTESWSAVSGATGYNVYIGGTKVNSTPVTGTSYNVTGESASTTYNVTVTAVNTGGESSPSTADSVTTLPNAPGVPTGLSHNSVTQTGWTESWSPVSGATGYNVYIGGTKVNSTPVTGTSYNVIGESASTTYKVTVTAVNTGGESSPSAVDPATTLPNAPGVPTGLGHNSVTQTGWTESWSAVNGASSYNVYIGGTKVNSTPVTGTSYNVTGESANTTYNVTVTAVNTGGESSPSTADSVTTLYNTTGIPTGLHHSGVTTTGWQETWTPVTGTNVGTVTYDVYLNGNQVGTTSSTSYSFTGLSSGTTYTVTIASVNGSHQVSGQSNPDQVTTGVPLSVGTSWAWNAQYGVSYNALQLEAVSGSGPYTWSIIQGGLPMGLKLSSDGIISGTPTGPSVSSSFTVQVTDAGGQTASKPLSIQVWGAPPLTIQSTSLPVGKMGQTYSAQLLANGGQPFQWSLVSGTLPKGVSLSPDGLLSGLPTESGNFTLTVQVSDGAGNPVQETLQLDIQPLPAGEALLNFNGHIQTIPVVITSGTAYLPIWYLMQQLNPAGIQDYWLGHDWYLNNTTQSYLYFLQPGLGTTSIYLNGVLVQNVTPESVIDPSTSRLTTCLPFWSLKDLLSRIGYQTSWDGTTWTVTK